MPKISETAAVAAALLALPWLFVSPAMAGPIHDAAKAADVAQVQQLIASGTDVDDRDAAKKTALHWAAQLGHTEVAELLVENGADVNAMDFANYTPLHTAGYYDREAIAGLLIASGADVNALDRDGITPLDRPANNGFAGTVAILKGAGARCGTHYQSCQD